MIDHVAFHDCIHGRTHASLNEEDWKSWGMDPSSSEHEMVFDVDAFEAKTKHGEIDS